MTQQPETDTPRVARHPKWFLPSVFALSFTLSFVGAELFGPLGAVFGLLLGVGAGWAGSKWVFKAERSK